MADWKFDYIGSGPKGRRNGDGILHLNYKLTATTVLERFRKGAYKLDFADGNIYRGEVCIGLFKVPDANLTSIRIKSVEQREYPPWNRTTSQ
jgi:hypothetical protein